MTVQKFKHKHFNQLLGHLFLQCHLSAFRSARRNYEQMATKTVIRQVRDN